MQSRHLSVCLSLGLSLISLSACNAIPNAALGKQDIPLNHYHWHLVTATDRQHAPISALLVRPQRPITLDFQANIMTISNACNTINMSYTLKHQVLQLGSGASTMMACAEPLNTMEHQVTQIIAGQMPYQVHQSSNGLWLTLSNKQGDTLTLNGVLRDDVAFGAPKRIFYEVAPLTKSCVGVMPMQCLQVRQITYDQNGIQQKVDADWQNFYDPIEGYTHDSHVRTILRINQYDIPNPPADASSKKYVLDMVVESEVISTP